MSEYFLHYAESNICCAVIFGIMLAHDLMSVDRQEKQIKFDRVLAAFIAYFISDVFWAAVITGTIPKTIFSASLTNISNLVLMILITYCWFNYAMAVLQSPNRNRPLNKFAVLFPLLMSFIVVMDAVSNGEITLSDSVTIPDESARLSRTADGAIYLEPGWVTDVTELLCAMLLPSSNESALALAIHVAGSEAAFVARMNEKARLIGLSDGAVFYNCHGLPAFTDNLAATNVEGYVERGVSTVIGEEYQVARLQRGGRGHPTTA